MKIHSGKKTSYTIGLKEWGPQTEYDDVSLSEAFYNSLALDDEVNVYLKEGKYGIPWFILSSD